MSTSRFYDHDELPGTEMAVHQFTTAQPSRVEGMREAGMLAVCHAILESGWRSVREISPPAESSGYTQLSLLFLRAERRQNGRSDAFQWSAPPRLKRTNAFPLHLKEWDSEVSEDEVFDLHVLEEFEHNLDDQEDEAEKEAPSTNLNHAPMANQLSLDVDRYAMPNLVPKPHFLSTPPGKKLSEPSEIVYDRVPCVPLAPFSGASPQDCLGSAWSRCGWIIPLQGSLPVDGCSAGFVTSVEGPKSSPAQDRLKISWTHAAVSALWTFLNTLLESGKFGQVSLSYQAPSSADGGATVVRRSYHIKIYHDARHSLQIRKALDLWSVEAAAPSSTGAPVKKVRLLKGHRLLLVDQRNAPVLYC